jgi:cleavage and polyadenylation specificity factor subunit 1
MPGRGKRSRDCRVRHRWLSRIIYGPESECCSRVRWTRHVLSSQIFVRAFDLDERLVGVAFLDVGVYVTTLRALKNLLIIGDAVKSVWFVAFQVRTFRYGVFEAIC